MKKILFPSHYLKHYFDLSIYNIVDSLEKISGLKIKISGLHL